MGNNEDKYSIPEIRKIRPYSRVLLIETAEYIDAINVRNVIVNSDYWKNSGLKENCLLLKSSRQIPFMKYKGSRLYDLRYYKRYAHIVVVNKNNDVLEIIKKLELDKKLNIIGF